MTTLDTMATEYAEEHKTPLPPKPKKKRNTYFCNKFSFKGMWYGYWWPTMLAYRTLHYEYAVGKMSTCVMQKPWFSRRVAFTRAMFWVLVMTPLAIITFILQLIREVFFSKPKGAAARQIELFRRKWSSVCG